MVLNMSGSLLAGIRIIGGLSLIRALTVPLTC